MAEVKIGREGSNDLQKWNPQPGVVDKVQKCQVYVPCRRADKTRHARKEKQNRQMKGRKGG